MIQWMEPTAPTVVMPVAEPEMITGIARTEWALYIYPPCAVVPVFGRGSLDVIICV